MKLSHLPWPRPLHSLFLFFWGFLRAWWELWGLPFFASGLLPQQVCLRASTAWPQLPEGPSLGLCAPKLRETRRGGPSHTPCIWLLAPQVHTWLRLSGCRAWWGLTGCLRRTCSTPCASRHRVPQPPPLGLCKPGTGTPGSGEAAAFQEVSTVCVYPCLCVLGAGVSRRYRW